LAMSSAPDLVGFSPVSRALEREWARAAESLADARASAGRSQTALALAATLVKVARLAALPPGLPASGLHEGGDVEARVRWLVQSAGLETGGGDPSASDSRADAGGRATGRGWMVGVAVAAVVAPAVVPVLPAVHRLLEAAVHFAR